MKIVKAKNNSRLNPIVRRKESTTDQEIDIGALIRTEPVSPSKPILFAPVRPEGFESEISDSESEAEIIEISSDSEAELDLNEKRNSAECRENCGSDCELPPPCTRDLPWALTENVCRQCAQRFPSAESRILHEILHLGSCRCGYRYSNFEDLHRHIPECNLTHVFKCEYHSIGCKAEFRSIRDFFHHICKCPWKCLTGGRKRFLVDGRLSSRPPPSSESEESDDE